MLCSKHIFLLFFIEKYSKTQDVTMSQQKLLRSLSYNDATIGLAQTSSVAYAITVGIAIPKESLTRKRVFLYQNRSIRFTIDRLKPTCFKVPAHKT